MERVESEILRPPEQDRAAISIFRADNCKLRIQLLLKWPKFTLRAQQTRVYRGFQRNDKDIQ